MTATLARPASPKQVEWIDKMITEKGLTHDDMAARTGHAYEDLTTKTAGTWLDILFNLPTEGAASEPGLYAHDGVLYRAQRTQDGTRVYAKEYDSESGKFVYNPEGVKFRNLLANEVITEVDAIALYGYVPPKPKKAKRAPRNGVPTPFHDRFKPVPLDETPAQYNTRTGQGVPPGFVGNSDADLLAHFGI